jgi:hypothetical protein
MKQISLMHYQTLFGNLGKQMTSKTTLTNFILQTHIL